MFNFLSRKGFVNLVCLSFLTVSAGSALASNDVVYRINSGGKAFKDSSGQNWSSDAYFKGGRASTISSKTDIKATNDDALYQSSRDQNKKDQKLEYRFPVKNGNYDVHLHFAETSKNSQARGKRVFHIEAEGSRLVSNYDPFRSAGAGFKATVKTVSNIKVTDGRLDLKLPNSKQRAFISGIEVIAKNQSGGNNSNSSNNNSGSGNNSNNNNGNNSGNNNGIAILAHPSNALTNPGQRVVMEVKAKSNSKLKYQWYFKNKIMKGKTSARLVIASAKNKDTGNYYCVIKNGSKTVRTYAGRLIVAGNAGNNISKTATLNWSTPNKRTNGKKLLARDISHYEVYYSDSSAGALDLKNTVDGSKKAYVASGLDRGNHYFALVTVDSDGNRSDLSKTIKVNIK